MFYLSPPFDMPDELFLWGIVSVWDSGPYPGHFPGGCKGEGAAMVGLGRGQVYPG